MSVISRESTNNVESGAFCVVFPRGVADTTRPKLGLLAVLRQTRVGCCAYLRVLAYLEEGRLVVTAVSTREVEGRVSGGRGEKRSRAELKEKVMQRSARDSLVRDCLVQDCVVHALSGVDCVHAIAHPAIAHLQLTGHDQSVKCKWGQASLFHVVDITGL